MGNFQKPGFRSNPSKIRRILAFKPDFCLQKSGPKMLPVPVSVETGTYSQFCKAKLAQSDHCTEFPQKLRAACPISYGNRAQSCHCTEFCRTPCCLPRFAAANLGPIRPLHGVLQNSVPLPRFAAAKRGAIRPLHGVLQKLRASVLHRCSNAGSNPTTARSSAELRAACPALLQQSWAQSPSSARFYRNGHFLPSIAAAMLGPIRPLHRVSAETLCRHSAQRRW